MEDQMRKVLLCHILIWGLVVSTMAVIDEGEQRIADRVINLPGQPPVNFLQYAGYIQLQSQSQKSLFYWFIESEYEPITQPLILWLNGGPGCSSVANGAAQEIGPFLVRSNYATNLTLNEYSWNKVANLLFLESPVGVGFSYTTNSSDLLELGDKVVANDTLSFLLGWFQRFPDYIFNDFYIIGESYGGHYAPQLADLIYEWNNRAIQDTFINLKGFMMGNAIINDQTDSLGFVEYAWSHAIISDKLYKLIRLDCADFEVHTTSDQCNDHLKVFFDAFVGIDIFNIYSPTCPPYSPSIGFSNGTSMGYGSPNASRYDPCINNYVRAYFNREDVQKALHANVTKLSYPYNVCSPILTKWIDSPDTMLPTIQKLLEAGMRIWFYSGDVDGRVPVTATRYSVYELNLLVTEEWRPWFHFRQVGGWVETYDKGLTLATIRGAGHNAPITARGPSLTLISHFLTGLSLPSNGF